MTRSEDMEVVKKGMDNLVADLKAVGKEQERLETEKANGNIQQEKFQEEWEATERRINEIGKMITADEDLYDKLNKGHELSDSQKKLLERYRKLYSSNS